ncbi:serine proteinase 1 [Penaeus vannamei]|uniref:Serine proteinase 1 n=1 Tax=Penaeus vannamei TaxID=6689 RepID=A0A3R7N077_PENVA|nr:phenoloxidase-activating factor 2-like [Penaeus vannamei]ROT73786.1 serine proteinase 1 [Penaeus vannamei]
MLQEHKVKVLHFTATSVGNKMHTRLATVGALTLLWALGAAASRLPRQAVDTSNISNDDIICLISGTCNNSPQTPSPVTSSCTCVKWWQCNDNEVTDGTVTMVDLRVNGACPEDVNNICCENFDLNKLPPTSEAPVTQCGQRNEVGVGANFQGFNDSQAQFGEFPWMAAVLTRGVSGTGGIPVYVCGASLIHPRVVLTAAHNVQDKQTNNIVVRLGEWDFKNPSEPIVHQEIGVSQILMHTNYDSRNINYDVALLILERAAELGPTVQTVCLPSPRQTFDGMLCVSSGWGKNSFGGKYQQILKSIDLPVVNHGRCESALRSSPRLGLRFSLHRSFMCAGGNPGEDACTGDGGSPLVCPVPGNPSTYVQVGVVSWGLGCGQAGIPGVYASVSEALPWISRVVQEVGGINRRRGR